MHHASYFWMCVRAFSPGFRFFFRGILALTYLTRTYSNTVGERKKKTTKENSNCTWAKVWADFSNYTHLRNTENILSNCLYHSPPPHYLNKYIFLLGCQHSCFKRDECISSRSLLLQAWKWQAFEQLPIKTGMWDRSVVFWRPVFKELITRNWGKVAAVSHVLTLVPCYWRFGLGARRLSVRTGNKQRTQRHTPRTLW